MSPSNFSEILEEEEQEEFPEDFADEETELLEAERFHKP